MRLWIHRVAFLILFFFAAAHLLGQSQAGSIRGTIVDPSGAVVPGATVTVQNPVSNYSETTTTDADGNFHFNNLPFNPYHLSVQMTGFQSIAQDVDVRSAVATAVKITLPVGAASTTVTVTGAEDLVENNPTFHTDIDRKMFSKIPLESQSSSVSSLVTLATPGVAADSNGMFHGLGDHAENSFSIDGQPVTDQVSKVFSNQIPLNSIQSIEAIAGVPPAEYGDKTSLVIKVTTRSGLGVTKPTGSMTGSYGSFGSTAGGFDLSYGTQRVGNFIELDGLNTGRFLDGPEFSVFHDKGNEENIFDRADYVWKSGDSAHINLNYTRSWFQTPNTYDNLNLGKTDPLTGAPLPVTDQKSQINTFDIAPYFTHILNSSTVLNGGLYVRKDAYYYYPSGNPFADLGPPSLQRETVAQERTLLNPGVHMDVTYAKGIQNLEIGGDYEQTILRESFGIGVVDPILNAPCVNAQGDGVPGFTDPSQCTAAGYQPNVASNPNAPGSTLYPYFNPVLLPYDLTRGGHDYHFLGHTDVKELALYIDDQITKGPWYFRLGMRGDFYNGLTVARQAEPRVGISYKVKPSNTVLRIGYGRTLETPFNENLVLSSLGPYNPVINGLIPSVPAPLNSGFRNVFDAGLQQAFGRHVVINGDYLWKYTHNGFDFSVLGNTPITFPIEWNNSKITGFAINTNVTQIHGFSAFVTVGSVAARFFTPQIGGLGVVPAGAGQVVHTPFRIDHDEKLNETTHVQYQFGSRGPWLGFNWRYDSGLVAASTPCYANTATCAPSSTLLNGQPAIKMVSNNVPGVPLTADEEFEGGFYCGAQHATRTQALPFICPASQFGSTLINVPAPGTENDDKNPQRIRQRSLYDISFGDSNLFHGTKNVWTLQVTALNIANRYALYNWLSTFSGTHYVTPTAITAQMGFHF